MRKGQGRELEVAAGSTSAEDTGGRPEASAADGCVRTRIGTPG